MITDTQQTDNHPTLPLDPPNALLRSGGRHVVIYPPAASGQGERYIEVEPAVWRDLLAANEARVTYCEPGYSAFTTVQEGPPMIATQSTIDRLSDATPASPICPICGWVKVPLSDGRLVCRDCGHEQSGGNGDETAADTECPFCGALLVPGNPGATCPDCGAAFNGTAELAQAGDLMALGEHDEDDVVDPAVVADEIAALNRVRFTIEIHTDAIGRPCGATATATDWPGGDQWTQ